MEDIESKLDLLIDLYKDDRKLLLHHIQQQYGAAGQPPPPSQAKPRPILVDKQFTSEPATPTGVGQNPDRPMYRNLSDLSQRIKKRVTYRCLSLNDPPKRDQAVRERLLESRTSRSRSEEENEGSASERLCVSDHNASQPQASTLRPNSPPLLNAPYSGTTCTAAYGGGCDSSFQDDALKDCNSDVSLDFTSEASHPSPIPSPSLRHGCSGDGFSHARPSFPFVASYIPNSVLSTLSEQKSIESDCSITCLDSSPAEGAVIKYSDGCNGTAQSLTISSEMSGNDSNLAHSRTSLTNVPTLENLTDFHVDCEAGKIRPPV